MTRDQALTAAMIDNSGNAAASALCDAIGEAADRAAAARTLGLRHTVPGVGDPLGADLEHGHRSAAAAVGPDVAAVTVDRRRPAL